MEENNMQVIMMSVLILLFFCSCERTTGHRFDPFEVDEKALSTNSIIGIWMMDEASTRLIKELGYLRYQNSTDHILRLNQDGSCVYTGFAIYINRKSLIAEQDEVNNMRNYFNDPSPEVTDRFYWFEGTNTFPFVIGPYQDNKILTNDSSRVFEKTVWCHWQTYKRTNMISIEDFTQPHYWRYKLRLYPTKDETFDGSSVDMYFAKDERGLYLFVPVVTDDGPIVEGVKFRKVMAVKDCN